MDSLTLEVFCLFALTVEICKPKFLFVLLYYLLFFAKFSFLFFFFFCISLPSTHTSLQVNWKTKGFISRKKLHKSKKMLLNRQVQTQEVHKCFSVLKICMALELHAFSKFYYIQFDVLRKTTM